jgi:HTH-type transcriptional regulator/antitoxin HipB
MVTIIARVQTPYELGRVVRDRRRRLGLTQDGVARRVGVSRQWMISLEAGRARLEFGLVLRTLSALGLALDLVEDQAEPTATRDIDLDALIKGRS